MLPLTVLITIHWVIRSLIFLSKVNEHFGSPIEETRAPWQLVLMLGMTLGPSVVLGLRLSDPMFDLFFAVRFFAAISIFLLFAASAKAAWRLAKMETHMRGFPGDFVMDSCYFAFPPIGAFILQPRLKALRAAALANKQRGWEKTCVSWDLESCH